MKVRMYNLHSKYYRKGEYAEKSLSNLALPLHVVDELLEKLSYHLYLIRYTIKHTTLLLLKNNANKNIPPLQSGRLGVTTLHKLPSILNLTFKNL
jgi:hypothetical protein